MSSQFYNGAYPQWWDPWAVSSSSSLTYTYPLTYASTNAPDFSAPPVPQGDREWLDAEIDAMRALA